MKGINIGFGMCGSFCTLAEAIEQMEHLVLLGANVWPIMSATAYTTSTRFGEAEKINRKIEEICQKNIIHDIASAEPIGPKKLLDVMVVAPCTGNTMAKLAAGITDTSITMAVKAHLRNDRPVVLAPATNDALTGSAKNIGKLLNTKNVYFVPFGQDDATNKPASCIADFRRIPETISLALVGKQIQPLLQ